MSENIQFKEENKMYESVRHHFISRLSFLTIFVLKIGLAKDERELRNVFITALILVFGRTVCVHADKGIQICDIWK